MAASLAARLEADDTHPTVAAFPDGSVDRFYEVSAGGERIADRDGFVEAISTGRSPAVTLRETAVEPGGHAVNIAVQAGLLGNDVTLLGHLDDPVFGDLPVEPISMGAPARVDVYGFDDSDVLAVEPSDDIAQWSFGDVVAATDGRHGSVLSADVVFCANWRTLDALPDVLHELAGSGLDGDVFLIDPGRVSDRPDAAVERLFGALCELGDAFEVVLAANGEEIHGLADAVAGDGTASDEPAARLGRLREAGGLAAAVVHEVDAAIADTPGSQVRVENVEVEPVRHTGGGDRFDAGLGHALVRGWSWEDALRLANACASRYIATGESADASELAAFLRQRA